MEQKEKELQEHRVARENTRKEKAAKVARQKAKREAVKQQKAVDKQLANKSKIAKKTTRNKGKQKEQIEEQDIMDLTADLSVVAVSAQTRVGRKTRQPQHLKGYTK